MAKGDIIAHWKRGSVSALKIAALSCDAGEYEHTLSNCHLAVEKALKAQYLTEKNEDHPRTHDLERLSHELSVILTTEEYDWLVDLTEFVIDARYADPLWAKEQATKENATLWLERTKTLLSHLPSWRQ